MSMNYPFTPNFHEVLHHTVQHGAMLLPGYFSPAEVALLVKANQDSSMLERKVPKLGQLVTGVAAHLEEPVIGISRDTIAAAPPQSSCSFHTDSVARRGISLLVPLDGPVASFYYAPYRQVFPDDMSQSQELSYGPGDVAVLRQGVTVNKSQSYSQTYHLGVADMARQLLFCDIIAQHLTLPETTQ